MLRRGRVSTRDRCRWVRVSLPAAGPVVSAPDEARAYGLGVPLTLAGLGLGAVAFLGLVDPGSSSPLARLYLSCPSRTLFGVWCPLCGATRASRAALGGDWRLVLRANLLLPGVAILALWGWSVTLATALGWQRWPRIPRWRWLWWSVGAGVVVYTLLRNLPAAELLRPP